MSEVGKNPPRMGIEDIRAVDNALSQLGVAVDLPQRDPRRGEAAVALRRVGFDTSQIVTLSRGKWTRQSVDRWVEGASVSTGAPAERAVEIIADGVSRGNTLEHLLSGLEVQLSIAAAGATVEDILVVTKQLKDEGLQLSDFIEHYKMMIGAGLTFANVKEHLAYKKSLESAGLGLDALRLIQTAAAKFHSDPNTVLTAIDTYGEIQALTAELDRLRASKESEEERQTFLNTAVTDLESKQKTLQSTINDNENTIQQLNKTFELGFNLETLRNLTQQTRALGGVDHFLTALAEFENLDRLKGTVTETQTSIEKLNADRGKLRAGNLQYEAEIETTRRLINEHKLGLNALQELLQLCEKHGAPEGVFRIVRAYDNLQTIETQLANQRDKVAELTKQEQQLNEKLKEHIPEIAKTMKSIETDFRTDVDKTKVELKTDLDYVLKTANEAGRSYQDLVTRANESAPYMELLQLVKDPKSVDNPRILDTVELILNNLNEWVPLNEKYLRDSNDGRYLLVPRIRDLLEAFKRAERVRP
jgi:peptidoglycan hydrolase CwlO-like protein